MKRNNLLFLFTLHCLFFCAGTYAQVYNGDIIFSNQADIDNFSTAPYTSVTGNLVINDSLDGQYDIRNLAGLGGLISVNGVLIVKSNPLLSNTVYLNLQDIGSGIRIENNPSLTILNGMGGLARVGLGITISNNNSLTNLPSLSGLIGASTIVINNNPALVTLNGLQNVRRVNSVVISGNNALVNINDLNNQLVIKQFLTIEENPSLLTINLPNALDSIIFLFVRKNNSLTSMQSPSTGCRLMGTVQIQDNPVLTSINGFAKTESVNTIDIQRNAKLSTFNAFANIQQIINFILMQNYDLANINTMPFLDTLQNLEIKDDTLLTSLNFLSGVADIKSLYLFNCPNLLNLNGLVNFQSTELDKIDIAANRSLTQIDKFSNVVYVKGDVRIGANNSLISLQGLQNLRKIDGDLILNSLPLIKHLNSLINLGSIGTNTFSGRGLSVQANPGLINIDGLKNLRKVAGSIFVTQNASLSSFCGLYGLYAGNGAASNSQIILNLINPTPSQIIAGGPCSGTLPVSLQLFNFICEGNKVKLSWRTAQEQNSSHFNIERGENGNTWTVMGNKTAAGNSSTPIDYSFTDNSPLQNVLYRLVQYDVDGRVHYSGVLRPSCGVKELFTAWPNPVADKLFITITSPARSRAIIRMYDSKGALIKKQESILLRSTTQLIIDTKNIAPGMYYVQAGWNDEVHKKIIKFIKQ
jgi:Secretion system C-terminal sorting domain/Receptor L domain